ncbi:DUF4175 domain-containing protein [Chitinophaga vietnamensis]|uniref:DUF4175 domain-containing protein n=1 Tax=Chitinophaga vietnamensis TaxID=2593957 RepID=UPI0011776155|nr:DUF4175 domain-containing protein [Chitinophaga vietnamensis]
MNNARGYTKIESVRRRWNIIKLLAILLQSLAVAALGWSLFGARGIWASIVALALLLYLFRRKPLQREEVARYLDQTFPQLEDSSALHLLPSAALNMLQRLQLEKTTGPMEQLLLPRSFYKPLLRAAVVLLAAMVASAAIRYWRPSWQQRAAAADQTTIPEKILPGITQVKVRIIPPAYTKLPAREQAAFHIRAEDSAQLRWELHTNHAVKQLALLFSDSTRINLQPDADSTTWTATRLLQHPGFYQVQLDKDLSEFYQLEMIPDQPPTVKISSPQPYTVIDFGMPLKVAVKAAIADDYGIRDAVLHATITSGSGEAIRFRDTQFVFDQSLNAHLPRYELSRQLNLGALHLQPGDELYFHIAVTDSRRQQTLSDVYIVTLPDTAQLFNLEGVANGVNIKPEYFRSQRQIIIETEQLIRERDSLPVEKFKDRSNGLGTDQKLLRLRYGKFLGEESESNVGDSRVAEEDDHDHGQHAPEKNDASDFGNAAKILDEFTDKHDNAEDASFFEPAVKQQLKATLNEMWKAELQLRLFKPQDALPFEYKALRLLKDLQQKSRAYVAKTGVKTTPLKPEKRLSGELDKIDPLVLKDEMQVKDDKHILRIALSVLDHTGPYDAASLAVLQQALPALGSRAAAEPAAFLPAMEALSRIVQGKSKSATDAAAAQRGLLKMLPAPLAPQPDTRTPQNRLQQYYWKNLYQRKGT